MEQARLFIAIGISFVIFMIWGTFFDPKKDADTLVMEPTANVETFDAAKPPEKRAVTQTKRSVSKRSDFTTDADAPPKKEGRTLRIETSLYEARMSEDGARLESFALKDYREDSAADSPRKELVSKDLISGPLTLDFLNQSIEGLDQAVFEASVEGDVIEATHSEKELVFAWTSPDGVLVEKRYLFHPDRYDIAMEVVVANRSERRLRDSMAISLTSRTSGKKAIYGFEGPSVMVGQAVEQIDIDDNDTVQTFAGDIKFAALETTYFMGSIMPENGLNAEVRAFKTRGDNLYCQLVYPGVDIEPGKGQAFKFNVYYGPKSLDILQSVSQDLAGVVNFGWFDFIAKPCLWLMKFFYKYIPNYGISIILLTLFIKLLLWPLGVKSYKSMAQMKKLQPLMTDIREKYKNDKKKMNEEVMSLYKTYKVNPVGGCLPMVAQIPVFFAFYRMLYQAIELRHAPFFLWINDLSAPDRLFSFPFDIPFMEAPHGIPVLTIIMGASMFLQQKMSPPMGDPKQAKMMMTLMPIVFTIMFINFSSGLVLYWLINNVLSIAQQYYITQKNM